MDNIYSAIKISDHVYWVGAIDWTIRENVRAQLRVIVKRILRKHGYPPDRQESATQTVLEQAAVLMDGEVAEESTA